MVPKGSRLSSDNHYNCKLGGDPNWIQGREHTKCRKCGSELTFIGQLASVGCSKDKRLQDLTFGDCGAYYVFSCFECGRDDRMFFQQY